MRRLFVLAMILVLSAVPALAAPTGLTQIPTPDLIPFGQFVVELQNGNTSTHDEPTVIKMPAPMFQSQVGLSSRMEAGVDLIPTQGLESYKPVANVKWDALLEDYDNPALALGAQNVGLGGLKPQYYVVMTRTLNYQEVQYTKFRAHRRNIRLRGRRVHAGLLRVGKDNYAMLGSDIELGDNVVLYADWIAGGANAGSLGGTYVIDSRNSFVLAALYGNRAHRFNGVQFTYTLQMKL